MGFWTVAHRSSILSIDDTHMYGKFLGTLLVATGVDANQGLFSLAFDIVQMKSWQTWSWFVRCMLNYISQTAWKEFHVRWEKPGPLNIIAVVFDISRQILRKLVLIRMCFRTCYMHVLLHRRLLDIMNRENNWRL